MPFIKVTKTFSQIVYFSLYYNKIYLHTYKYFIIELHTYLYILFHVTVDFMVER